MGVPIATLRDDFADNSQAAAWSESYVTGSATKAESGGQAVFTLPNLTGGTHEAAYKSAATYDLTGDGAYINIGTMVATGVAATAFFDLVKDSSNYYRWRQVSNAITARKVVAGVETQLFTATWNATTYKYLRIRESGGTVYFDSSSNGTSWTNRATSTLSGDFAITDLAIAFGASCGNVASPGSFRLDDYNLLSLATNWRWVQGRREYAHRIGSITIAASGGVGYVAVAQSVDASGNLVSPRYFAGPQDGGRVLTEQASQAAAQAMAVNLPTSGRWDLPGFVEGRFIRLYHRSHNGSSYTIRECYFRRFIQADDIEAESIRALHIAAASITADRLSVLQLSAITADMGTLTAGTITGATIRTAASGARVVLDSTGISGYNSGGTLQARIRTSDGAFEAGGGKVLIDATGLKLQIGTLDENKIRWTSADGATLYGQIYTTLLSSTDPDLNIGVYSPGDTRPAIVRITGDGGTSSGVVLSSAAGASGTSLTVSANSVNGDVDIVASGAGAPTLSIRGTNANLYVAGPINGATVKRTSTAVASGSWTNITNAGRGLLVFEIGDRSSVWLWNESSDDLIKIGGTANHLLLDAVPGSYQVNFRVSGGYIQCRPATEFGSSYSLLVSQLLTTA